MIKVGIISPEKAVYSKGEKLTMSLSNTAVPIYYGRFRDKVINGEIPVNREIAMEMNRIDELIENPNIYYDDEAINGFVDFCENELT